LTWPGLDVLPHPIALLDGQGRITAANTALECLFQKEALPGQDWTGLLDELSVETRMADEGMVRRVEVAGKFRWLGCDVIRLDGDQSYAMLTDVTAAQTLTDARAANRVRDTLMQEAEVGIWRHDPDTDQYYFSRETTHGMVESDVGIPTSVMQQALHRDDIQLDADIRRRMTTEGGVETAELRFLNGEGGWRHLSVRYRSGARTPSGRYEMFGLAQNITEQAKARDAAQTAAQRLRLALDAARAGVFEFDYKKQKFWFSPDYIALVSPEVLQTCQGDPFQMFHPDDRQAAYALGERDDGQSRPEPIDVRLLRTDGYAWVRLYYEVDRLENGAARHGVGLMIDVDDEKRLELELVEARRAAEAGAAAKSDFLASVSHEIRTPMNGIVGILHLLKREPLSAEAGGLLDEAIGCSGMLGQIINDVLDFSKMEAGKLDLSPVPTDPAAILDSVAALVRPQIEAKGLYLRIRNQPDIGWLNVDPVRLRQCLFNTIGNAAKFTATGGVEVRMTLIGEGDGRRLRCEIEDSGIGIPAHVKDGLFDRFKQADSGTARKFGGTGLGLAISRDLTRMMGGDMDFDSIDGQGSTFWFEIAAPAAEALDEAAQDDLGGAILAGLNVLVVDDNRVNRLVAVKSLEAMGATAEAVDGGQAALDAVQLKVFDLVLMDVNMPGMDGMEATRRLRALPGPAAQLPVIALTADVMTHHLQRYRAAGMNGFVPKPFAPIQLLNEIMRLAGVGHDDAGLADASVA
jgi:signal transduction histidine kinase